MHLVVPSKCEGFYSSHLTSQAILVAMLFLNNELAGFLGCVCKYKDLHRRDGNRTDELQPDQQLVSSAPRFTFRTRLLASSLP